MLVGHWVNEVKISGKKNLTEEIHRGGELLEVLSRVLPGKGIGSSLFLARRLYVRKNWKRSDFVSGYNELTNRILSEGGLSDSNRELLEVIGLERRILDQCIPYLKIIEIPIGGISHKSGVTHIVEGKYVYQQGTRKLSMWS